MLSLLGVVLIARPNFIFGVEQEPDNAVGAVGGYGLEKITPAERLGAVGSVHHAFFPFDFHSNSLRLALLGVVGATGACEQLRPASVFRTHACSKDISLRSIGKRAHALNSIVSFSMQCVIASTIGPVLSSREHPEPNKTLTHVA